MPKIPPISMEGARRVVVSFSESHVCTTFSVDARRLSVNNRIASYAKRAEAARSNHVGDARARLRGC